MASSKRLKGNERDTEEGWLEMKSWNKVEWERVGESGYLQRMKRRRRMDRRTKGEEV